jgi:hypothetical protein
MYSWINWMNSKLAEKTSGNNNEALYLRLWIYDALTPCSDYCRTEDWNPRLLYEDYQHPLQQINHPKENNIKKTSLLNFISRDESNTMPSKKSFICILKECSADTLQRWYSGSYICYQLYLNFPDSVPVYVSITSVIGRSVIMCISPLSCVLNILWSVDYLQYLWISVHIAWTVVLTLAVRIRILRHKYISGSWFRTSATTTMNKNQPDAH